MANVKISGLPTASTPLTGAELVPVVQSGVTSQTTVFNIGVAVRDYVSVKDFGAVGDGVTDDTAAIQAAVDSADQIYFPEGNYKCDGIITLHSNNYLYGAGPESTTIIKNGNNAAGQGVIYANSFSATAFVENLTIRDMTLDGQVATLGFLETRHLLSLGGVKNVLVDNCHFVGYRGDGIFLFNGLTLTEERHNINVTIQNCVFDGVNFNNRNGISVITGSGINILYNTFRNTSRSDMPGPIDFEPDTGISWAFIRDVNIIGNRIESYNGSQAIAVVTKNAPTMTTMSNIVIRNNYISGNTKSGALGILIASGETPISSTTTPMGVVIGDNTIVSDSTNKMYPFDFYNVRGVIVENNTFIDGTAAIIGEYLTSPTSAKDILITDNNFYKNGNASGNLVICSVDDLTINNNVFQEPNNGTATTAIAFLGNIPFTTSNRVKLTNNTFIKGASQTKSITVYQHTLSPTTNYYYGNRDVGGTLTNEFTYYYGPAELCYSGTFTPVLYDTGSGLTITQTSTGSYLRVGDLVNVTIGVTVTAISGVASGGLAISGLPFNTSATAPSPISVPFISNVDIPATYSLVSSVINPSTSIVLLRQQGDNVADAALVASALKSNSVIKISIMYQV